jgi:hypothetical protein
MLTWHDALFLLAAVLALLSAAPRLSPYPLLAVALAALAGGLVLAL